MISICLLMFTATSEPLFYNEPVHGSSDSVFEFRPLASNLTTLTTSSQLPLQIFLRKDKLPSSSEYDLTASNYLILESLDPNSTYFIRIDCKSSFSLLLENSMRQNLSDSLPITRYIGEASHHLYLFKFDPARLRDKDEIKVSLVYFTGKASLDVVSSTQNLSFSSENWEFGSIVKIKGKVEDLFWISVVGHMNTDYTLLADLGNEIEVGNGEISGLVEEHDMEYFRFLVDQKQVLKIKLSVFSGECDLYLSVNSRPSIQNHNWNFTDHGSKVIELSPESQQQHPGSQYYLAVHGKLSSAFALTIYNKNNSIHKLSSGFPTIGSVDFNHFDYFSILVEAKMKVSIQLSAGSGNPDLYAHFCNTTEKNCEFSIKDVKSPGKSIIYSNHTFGIEEIHAQGNGELVVAVFGASDVTSEFTIVAVIDDDEVLLKSGSPATSTIVKDGYRFFKYKLAKWSASSVQFLLTPISGNPDLYVSRSKKPSTDEYDASSAKNGLEIDSITFTKGKDYESLNGTYYISIYSSVPSQFSIVAKENHPGGNTTVQLYPGIPQKDTFYSHCMKHRLYFFPIKFTKENQKSISITLTAITGNFLLAVTNKIDHIDHQRRIFYYHWSTESKNHETANTILIKPNDQFYLLQSTYAILVNTLEFGSDNTATYSIVLRIGDDLVLLTDGSPIIDLVKADKYNFYTFPVTFSREDVFIKVSLFSGDLKCFVAVNNTKPDEKDSQMVYESFEGMNAFEIKILASFLDLECPEFAGSYHHGNSSYCSLYIGVTSKGEAKYSISAHANQIGFQMVIIPSTVLSALSEDVRYYYGFPNSTRDILIDCQLAIGQAEIYVNLLPNTYNDISKVTFPTSTNNDFTSTVYLIHSQRVKITHLDFKSSCGSNCLIVITIECKSGPCEYTLSLSQDNLISLIDGENFLSNVEKNSYVYFSYYCGREDQNFVIVLNALDSGDPDLYVKKTIDKLPSKIDFDWKAETWQGEALVIDKNDEIFFNRNSSIRGTFVIAVYGKTNSSFQIRVTQDPKPVVKLVSGIPESKELPESEYAYYYYRSNLDTDIVVQVTPFYGKAVLYAKTQDLYTTDFYESLPSSSDYIFSSLLDISQYNLVIPHSSPYFCTSCNIIIAVKSTTNCSYSIQASNRQKLSLLQNGIPLRGEVEKKKWNYYYFQVNTFSDLDFSLMPFSGDPDLFINTEPDVTFSNAKWSSLAISSYEHIIISREDPDFVKGGFYIGVYSNFESSYAITAHIKDSFVQLISGLPSYYSISPSSFMYFQYNQKSVVTQNVRCVLNPSQEHRPIVYIKISNETIYPGPKIHDYIFSSGDYKDIYSGLYMNLKLDPDSNLYLSVSAGDSYIYNFTLTCSGRDDATILKLNQEVFDQIHVESSNKLYEVNVEHKGTLTIFLIPCIGEPQLKISSNWTMEHKENPDIIVDRMTDGQYVAVINNANGRYYIEVNHKSKNELSYVISTYYTRSGQRGVVVPGNYGKIELEVVDSGVMVKWKSPVYENLTVYDGKVNYIVFKVESNDLVSACSIMMSRDSGKSIVLKETSQREYIFKGKKKCFINIIAVLNGQAGTFRFIPYDTVVVTPHKEGGPGFVWIWILAVCVGFVLLIVMLMFRRTKSIQRRIDIEMTVGRDLPMRGTEKVNLRHDYN